MAYELNRDTNDFSRDVKVKTQSGFCWVWERVSSVFKCRNILKDRINFLNHSFLKLIKNLTVLSR